MKRKETYLSRDFRETVALRFPAQAKELNTAFDMRLSALLAENAGASKEKQYHLKRQILPGIAAYETLQRVMPKEEALQTVHGYVERLARTSHKQLAALLHIPGLYRLVPGVFVKSTRSVFGPAAGFAPKELQTGNGVWRVDMMKCPYHDTCAEYGCPELCRCFCDSDDISYAGLHPKLIWERSMTLGRGNDARCRGFESLRAHLKTHCNVLLQCAFWFDVILVSESLQQPILCQIGVLPFCRFLISRPVYSGSHRHGGERRRLSIYESLLLDCGIRQALQNLSNICIDADGLPLNFLRANRLPLVDADVGGVRVPGCHLPEGVLDDDRGIIANAQLQKEDFPACTGTEKILIPLRRPVPALVFHKFIIAVQVHGQRFAAVWADGEQLGQDFHILLPLYHLPNDRFVIKSFLTARLTALEQTVIALCVEQPLFVKASLLKAVVHVGRNNEIIPILYQL